jgi:hypothetical protein
MKGTTMKARIAFISFILVFAFTLTTNAGGKNELQKYLSDTAKKVKATDNPVEKRQILSESFESMSKALDQVQDSWLISVDDQAGIKMIKDKLQEKQYELAGTNGEQAAEMITISVVTLLLILIVVILLV